MAFQTVTLAWLDQTSASRCVDSTSIPLKGASRNSCKILIAIQRSDQKLWPFRIVTLALLDHTSASPCVDSTSIPLKKSSGNFYEI
jgi:hypothetical protein